MNGISDFIQDNWYELGSLIAQFSIVAALLWYGRFGWKGRSEPLRQPELSPGTANAAAASAAALAREPVSGPEPHGIPAHAAASLRNAEPAPKSYETPAYTAVQQREANREAEPYDFPASTRASLQEIEQTARRYEIPPVFAVPTQKATAAGHGGVGRMLSPLPEPEASQAEPVTPAAWPAANRHRTRRDQVAPRTDVHHTTGCQARCMIARQSLRDLPASATNGSSRPIARPGEAIS